MFRGIVVILIPIVIIGLVLTAIRATIMAFRGDTDDDEVESDGFFSRIWDKFVEYLGSILVAIIIFFLI
ncbi:oxidoreductase [Helicobacter pylori]